MIKKCNDCGGEFDKDSMFHKKSAGRCIPCYKLSRKKSYDDNIEKRREIAKKSYYAMTPEQKDRAKERKKRYIEDNKDRIRENNKKWFRENNDRLKREGKCWNTNNKERIRELRKIRDSDPVNKKRRLEYQREYSKKNKERIREKDRQWELNPSNKIGRRLRSRVRSALKRNVSNQKAKKLDSNRKLLGISYDELVMYIKNLFTEGMSWDNYGSWHIDHIIPCEYFDLSIEENQRICFNYQNLNPMWSIDNQSKSNKIVVDNPEEFIDKIRQSLK